MSKLTGDQEFNGNVYVKDVGGYTGSNASNARTLAQAAVTSTTNGLKIVLVSSESQVGTDADTIYIVTQ